MSKSRLTSLVLVALFAFLLVGVIKVGGSAETAMLKSIFSSGGQPVAGGSVNLNGSLGQTITGISNGGSTQVGAGYWRNTFPKIWRVQVPAAMNNYWGGSREIEPNNTFGQANGPLIFDKVYFGSPDDAAPASEYDVFYFFWSGEGTLSVQLENFPAGQRLQLYDGDTNLIASVFSESNSYNLIFKGLSVDGKYYLVAFAESGHPATAGDYTFTVTVN